MEKSSNLKQRWFAFCEPCGFKKILDSADNNPVLDGLTSVKLSDIPGGAPELDPSTNKTINKKNLKRLSQVKCPNCGRAITVKKLPDVYSKSFKDIDEREQAEKQQAEKQQRMADGQPLQRDKNPDFLG